MTSKKAIRLIGNLLFVFFILIGVSSLYSIYQTKNNPGELPSVMGFKMMTVLTGSMEPNIQTGDLLIVKTIPTDQLKINDVITFRSSNNTPVTHRIIDLVNQNGRVLFQTKGDANNIVDEDLVQSEQVIGTMAIRIPKMGYVANFIKSPAGLITVAVIFIFFLLIGPTKKILLASKRRVKNENEA